MSLFPTDMGFGSASYSVTVQLYVLIIFCSVLVIITQNSACTNDVTDDAAHHINMLRDEISAIKLELSKHNPGINTQAITQATVPKKLNNEFLETLKILGKSIIGQANMDRVISEAHDVKEIIILNETILLTSHKDDNSIPRLRHEFRRKGGPYKFNRKLKDPPTDTPPVILDVGGNLGFASIAFAKFYRDAQIIVFEPNPYTYIYLRWNLFLNDIYVLSAEELGLNPTLSGIYPVFGGLAGGEKPYVTISMPSELPKTSQDHRIVYGSDTAAGNRNANLGVPIYSFSHFIEKHGLVNRGIDIAKMDCECCEYLLIPANKNVFGNRTFVKSLVGELHPFEKCRAHFNLSMSAQDDVVEALNKRGCGLKPEDFEGGFVGNANPPPRQGGKCCPVLCDNK